MQCARYQFVRISERCECCLITAHGGKSRPKLTKCQHRLSQHYKCKDGKKVGEKTERTARKEYKLKRGTNGRIFQQPIFRQSQSDGKRFLYIDVWLTYPRVAIPHRPKLIQKCAQVSVVCNVISHKTLNWFLFTIFFLSFSIPFFTPLLLSLSLYLDFFSVWLSSFMCCSALVGFLFELSFTLKALPCTVASTFRIRRECSAWSTQNVMSKRNPKEIDLPRSAVMAQWHDDDLTTVQWQ